MSEQEISAAYMADKTSSGIDSSSGTKLPSTPDRSHRPSTSSSSNVINKKDEPIIPSTPPLGSRRKFSSGAFQSPGDFATNSRDVLPPATPMSNSGKFKLSNVPETPFSAKSNNELTTSPLKSPSTFHDNEDSEKPPIRQISSTLKTRLSYAFVKYQHGWTNQSLDELEKTVGQRDSDLAEPFKDLAAAQQGQSKSYEDFWSNGNSSSNKKTSPSKVTKPSTNNLLKSPTKIKLDRDVNQIEDDGSANLAFLQAISKSRSPKRKPHLQSTLRVDASKYANPQQNPEAEAIESLMSLSSPQSFKPNLDLTNQNLPKQRLSFGDSLSRGSTTKNSPKRYQSNENAIETESDTEYEHSNSTDEEEISTESQSNEVKTENDEDMEIRTTSTISE